jgi:hypothetical protein
MWIPTFRQHAISLIGVMVLISILLGYMVFAPDAESFPWPLQVLLVMGFVSPVIIRRILRSRYEQFTQRLQTYLKLEGWRVDILADAWTLLPKHAVPTDKIGGGIVIEQQLVAQLDRDTSTSLVFIEYAVQEDKRSRSHSQSILALIHKLPGNIPGWVRVMPTSNSWRQVFDDVNLESNQFNRQVYLAAQPERLATYVFPPDFMAWYMDAAVQPWIHVEEKQVCVLTDTRASFEMLDQMKNTLSKVTEYIARSGSVEKSD